MLTICLLLAVVVLLLLLLVMKGNSDKKLKTLVEEQKKREYQMEYEKHNAEIISLQSQINPHFLYNTLEMIRSEAIMKNDFVAAEMSESLANYFRYNISKRKDIVTLSEELDNIDNYLSIQKKRFGDRIAYRLIFHSDQMEAEKALIPKLTLQPLVENAIFHGIEKNTDGGTVTIHVTVTAKRLLITVEDDGPSMSREDYERVTSRLAGDRSIDLQADNNRHGGIALVNINQRLKILYGSMAGLSFSATKTIGNEASVVLPYYTNRDDYNDSEKIAF